MGRLMGLEPTNAGTTIRCVNHFATAAILKIFLKSKREVWLINLKICLNYGSGGGDRTPDLTGMNRTL
jgi:hypothetical protein